IVAPASGLPERGASNFRVISATGLPCWSGNGIATSNSLDLQAGLPSSSVPFIGGTPESFSSDSKYAAPLVSASAPLIFIQSASCGLLCSNSACFFARIAEAVSIFRSAGGSGEAFAIVFNWSKPSKPPWNVLYALSREVFSALGSEEHTSELQSP